MDWMFLCQDKVQGPAHFEDGYLMTLSAPRPCSVDGRMPLNMERLAEVHGNIAQSLSIKSKTTLEYVP
jgi:hypothetical protein